MVQKFLGHKQIYSTMVYLLSQPSEVSAKLLSPILRADLADIGKSCFLKAAPVAA